MAKFFLDYEMALSDAERKSRAFNKPYAIQRDGEGFRVRIRNHIQNRAALKRCVAVVLPSWVIIERKDWS